MQSSFEKNPDNFVFSRILKVNAFAFSITGSHCLHLSLLIKKHILLAYLSSEKKKIDKQILFIDYRRILVTYRFRSWL